MKKIIVNPRTVICGFPGVGKAHLGSKYPTKVRNMDTEALPWNTGLRRKAVFPQKHVDAIRQCEIVTMVSCRRQVLECLADNHIPFITCYPSIDSKWTYLERYRQRGSSEAFIRLLDIMWSEWHTQIKEERRGKQSIELRADQYLSDVIEFS